MLITTLTPASKTTVVSKPTDQSITSSAVLVNDTALQFQAQAGATYTVTWTLLGVWAAAGGINVGVSVPTGGTQLVQAVCDSNGILPASGSTTSASTAIGLIPSLATGGTVVVSATITTTQTGTVSLMFAQQTSNGTPTTVKAGSNMQVVQQ